jgi:A/G-specific adenine glycosylase
MGLQEQLPQLPARPAIIDQDEVAVVLWRSGRVLIVQRPPGERWGGLWEFPHGSLQPGEEHTAAAARLLAQQTGLRAQIGPEITIIRHGITRFRIRLVCLEADHLAGEFRSDFYRQGVWVAPAALPDYPFSSPQRRLARLVGRPRPQQLF